MGKISVNGGIEVKDSGPDFSYSCQPGGAPWATVADAHNGTPSAYRGIGKLRFVADGNGGFDTYVYKGGVLLSNLVLQTVKIASTGHVTASQTAGGLQLDVTNWNGEIDGGFLMKDTITNAVYSISVTNGALVLTPQ